MEYQIVEAKKSSERTAFLFDLQQLWKPESEIH